MRDHSIIDALECYQHQPALLTKGMVALLTKADPAMGARAGVALRMKPYADAVITVIKSALASRDSKIAALEARVLELEAQQASRRELVP